MLDLDAIEARAEAAAPGPWREPKNGLGLGWTIFPKNSKGWSIATCDSGTDADFIAHARTDIPALVAELRAAREAKERVLDMHSSNSGGWCWECAHPSPCRTVTALAAYRAVVGEQE
jgi:predicted alpha/beta hydrolase